MKSETRLPASVAALPSATVPCAGCTACCKNELVFLMPNENPADYDAVPVVNPISGQPGFALAHKPNKECVYLDASGCTIHDRRPQICRAFDCRKLIRDWGGGRKGRQAALKSGFLSRDVYDAGQRRMHTLPPEILTLADLAKSV